MKKIKRNKKDFVGNMFLHSRKEYLLWLENAYSSAYYAGYRIGYEAGEKQKKKISEEHHTYPHKQ